MQVLQHNVIYILYGLILLIIKSHFPTISSWMKFFQTPFLNIFMVMDLIGMKLPGANFEIFDVRLVELPKIITF